MSSAHQSPSCQQQQRQQQRQRQRQQQQRHHHHTAGCVVQCDGGGDNGYGIGTIDISTIPPANNNLPTFSMDYSTIMDSSTAAFEWDDVLEQHHSTLEPVPIGRDAVQVVNRVAPEDTFSKSGQTNEVNDFLTFVFANFPNTGAADHFGARRMHGGGGVGNGASKQQQHQQLHPDFRPLLDDDDDDDDAKKHRLLTNDGLGMHLSAKNKVNDGGSKNGYGIQQLLQSHNAIDQYHQPQWWDKNNQSQETTRPLHDGGVKVVCQQRTCHHHHQVVGGMSQEQCMHHMRQLEGALQLATCAMAAPSSEFDADGMIKQQQPQPQSQPQQLQQQQQLTHACQRMEEEGNEHHNHEFAPPSVKFRKYQADLWDKRYVQLVQYHRRHGHCLVEPKDSKALSHWVKRQRFQYKKGLEGKHSTLTEERKDKLQHLGFVWDTHEEAWELRYRDLVAFRKETGHTNVPTVYEPNKSLGIWVKGQRRQYRLHLHGRKSTITAERIERLNALEFQWMIRPSRTTGKNAMIKAAALADDFMEDAEQRCLDKPACNAAEIMMEDHDSDEDSFSRELGAIGFSRV